MPFPSYRIRLGTRGSLLAMAQAESVATTLRKLGNEVEIVKIRTSGDAGNRERLGAFVSEIEEALRDGRVDIGLHCLKDIPTRPAEGLKIAAYLAREDPREALLTRGPALADLGEGAVIGTGSLRRTSQLASHGRFMFKPLVGNVDTRMGKLIQGEYDAILLAVAGLKRLNLLADWSASPYASISMFLMEPELILPAAGQATLVLQSREDSDFGLGSLNHGPTEICSTAERAFLARFGGGCSVPVAAYAEPVKEHYRVRGLIASPDGRVSYRGARAFGSEQAEFFGTELAEELGHQGGFAILESLLAGRQS